jgi:hypothetical protein
MALPCTRQTKEITDTVTVGRYMDTDLRGGRDPWQFREIYENSRAYGDDEDT